MHEFFQRWLARRPHCPGVLAWGVFFSDQTALSQSFAEGLTEEQVAPLWQQLAEAIDWLQAHALDTDQLRWVFTQRILYAATRSDGLCLAVLSDRKQDLAGRACVERTLADFKALPASASPH